MPSIRERRIVWSLLYVTIVALATLYSGTYGFLAAAIFLATGFWAGWTYRNDRVH